MLYGQFYRRILKFWQNLNYDCKSEIRQTRGHVKKFEQQDGILYSFSADALCWI